MPEPSDTRSIETQTTSLRRLMAWAIGTVLLLVGGLGLAAHLTEISGAVIASGRVVVESNIKRVQHREGGIVRAIHVREGDMVAAGDLLVQLDDTLPRANHAIITTRLTELQAQEARLKAERDGQAELVTPAAFEGKLQKPEITVVLGGQRKLLEVRRTSREGRKMQLGEQIKQFKEQIVGLEAQRDAKAREIDLVARELHDLSGLLAKGLIQRARITALKRDKARLEGEHGGFISEIARAGQAISEREIQILQIDEEMRAEVVEQLQSTRAEIAQLTEQQVSAAEHLRQVEVRAPRSGIVHQLVVHTVGGVVAPGEDLMLIVPQEDHLVIEARVAPADIDQIALAQRATIRLPGFDQRTTPELSAEILTVSADLIEDPATGTDFYQTRLALPESEIERLQGKPLVPGMPVEAFIQTDPRSILSYLVKPLADHIAHAFRDG